MKASKRPKEVHDVLEKIEKELFRGQDRPKASFSLKSHGPMFLSDSLFPICDYVDFLENRLKDLEHRIVRENRLRRIAESKLESLWIR